MKVSLIYRLRWNIVKRIFIPLLIFSCPLFAKESGSYNIYIDADWLNSPYSSRAIEWGIKTALASNSGLLGGRKVKIIRLDHRGNSKRHLRNQEKFLADNRALVVFTGLHSPPLIANRDFINQNEILTLDPWAAGGPITRGGPPNWIFRLSVDDNISGQFMLNHAIKYHHFKRPVIIAENTAWGQFNCEKISFYSHTLNIASPQILWANWGISLESAKIILRQALKTNPDVIMFILNSNEEATFVNGIASLKLSQKINIISHWGCSTEHFLSKLDKNAMEYVDLEFIQTNFSFQEKNLSPYAKKVFQYASTVFPDKIKTISDIKPPAAFIHAYDLMEILIAAANQCKLTGIVKADRVKLHFALENIETPVRGLIKTYTKPFREFSEENKDAHEALHIEDLKMAHYSQSGHIILIKNKSNK